MALYLSVSLIHTLCEPPACRSSRSRSTAVRYNMRTVACRRKPQLYLLRSLGAYVAATTHLHRAMIGRMQSDALDITQKRRPGMSTGSNLLHCSAEKGGCCADTPIRVSRLLFASYAVTGAACPLT